jgi:RimJ/RimL family protein N-acetyltransferase
LGRRKFNLVQSIFQEPPTLESERIKLIPMQIEHTRQLIAINHPEIWTFMLSEVKTENDMYKWVSNAIQLRQQGTALPFVVVLKETNQVVGTTRLFEINFSQKSCELGSTWYGINFQRTFVNSDSLYNPVTEQELLNLLQTKGKKQASK